MFAPLTIVEAPVGVPATGIGTLATHDLATVVLTLAPFQVKAEVVASEILRALGKRADVNGKARHGIDDKVLVPVWLTAHRVQTLIVAVPPSVANPNLTDLIDLCITSTTNLVLACDHGSGERLSEAVKGHLPTAQEWPTTPETHEPLPPASISRWKPGEPIRLPQCEFMNFYTTAERTLPPQVFAEVSARYIDALNRTLEWLPQVTATRDGIVPEQDVNTGMAALLADQQTLDQVATVVHAAQAAFFRHGWLLKVDRRELRSGLIRFPSPDVPSDAWTRIRAYREPARAATVSLYLSGLTIKEIEDTTNEEIARWHHDPTTRVHGQLIPTGAAPFLRAQLLNQATIGLAATDPFLPSSTARRIGQDVREASGDLDLFLADGALDKSTRHGDRRISNRAFTVEQLA